MRLWFLPGGVGEGRKRSSSLAYVGTQWVQRRLASPLKRAASGALQIACVCLQRDVAPLR